MNVEDVPCLQGLHDEMFFPVDVVTDLAHICWDNWSSLTRPLGDIPPGFNYPALT